MCCLNLNILSNRSFSQQFGQCSYTHIGRNRKKPFTSMHKTHVRNERSGFSLSFSKLAL